MSVISQFAGFFLLSFVAGVFLLRAAGRARRAAAEDSTERAMRVYKDQLKEVDRDLARGIIPASEAERLRLEISRRILDLDKAEHQRPVGRLSPDTARRIMLGVLAVAILGGPALYFRAGAPGYLDMPLAQRHIEAQELRRNRPDQLALEAEFEAAFGDRALPPENAELEPLVEQLRAALVNRPEDLTGFTLLAQNEARLGNLRAAIEAQEHVIALQGDAAPVDDIAFLLDLMVLAAGGLVSPQADEAIERILQRDPVNGVALYYTGRMYAQTDRPDMTFRIWRRLHDVSPGDAPWMPEIRAALPELARISGEPRFQLPPRPAPASVAQPVEIDPGMMDDLTEAEQIEMIEGMVESLAARLANQGGTSDDWARLIRAMVVLDRRDQARAILQEARTVFAGRSDDLALIDAAAQDAGLASPPPGAAESP